MSRFLPFVLFFLFFIFESLFIELFPAKLFHKDWIIVPHFLVAGILLLTIYGNRKLGIWYGLLFGLLFDIVYTEIIGVYLFMIPLTAYFVSKMMKILQSNIIIATFVVLLGIALMEIVVFEMNFLIHVTSMPFPQYVSMRLLPTLVLNFIFIILFVYPLKKQFEKVNDQLA
ncbi:rod shape-determining protein MreD [Bacillus sp. CGMCC 1.16607]|uniref:rod shape-determining protein MreD n=1 Tax=Bacillus sp. CGMCC 1.16607 TaxID=3351842 RepID=UPI00363A0F30